MAPAKEIKLTIGGAVRAQPAFRADTPPGCCTIDPMDPRIEYAVTADGVSIAYWRMGKGPPLVIVPPAQPWSHIERELQIPEWRHWYEHMAEMVEVIRYDGRGTGLSERDVPAMTRESLCSDLQAVADHAGLEAFGLEAVYYSGLSAVEYAVANPGRVKQLILWCAFANAVDVRQRQSSDALRQLATIDYTLFTETLAHQVFGWGAGEQARMLADYMRAAASPERVIESWNVHEDYDVTDLLPRVQAPTLVMHRRNFPLVSLGQARQLASSIPNARLVVLDGDSLSPYMGDMETPLQVMAEFLGVDAPQIEPHRRRPAGGFRTIMFTDIEGSTATTAMVGDDAAQDMLRAHNEVVRRALHAHAGTEVKHTGDGIMASFTSAVAALECGIAIQRALAAHTMLNAQHPAFAVRIGINAGEPVIEGGDLFGTAVQVASRICTRAEPRQILVSDVVRQLVAGKGFLFADRGETDLRGFEDPVRVFELRWHEGDIDE